MVSKRTAVLVPTLQHSRSHPLFYGFDRPSALIEHSNEITTSWSRYLSFRKLRLYQLAKSYVRENDLFFAPDIAQTEAWIEEHHPLLLEYASDISRVTHVSWQTNTISLWVHAINFAVTNNSTIIIGIRPPEVQIPNHLPVLLIHEMVHINLDAFPFTLDLEEQLVIAAGEVLALYFTILVLETRQDKDSIAARSYARDQWHRHKLTDTDWSAIHSLISKAPDQTSLRSVMNYQVVRNILEQYQPYII